MAIVGGRWWVEYTFVDSAADETTRRWELNAPVDYAAAVINELALRTDVNLLSDAVIKNVKVYQEFYENALALPAGGVQNENELLLSFMMQNPLKTATLTVPAPKATAFVDVTGPNANVAITTGIVANFASNFLVGGTALTLLSDGEQAASLIKGHRRHKATRVG
jgi:hypothetical protein